MTQSRPETFSDSYRYLQNAQKSPNGAPIYSLLVNRPLGRVFAAAANQLGMTPNQVTVVSAVFSYGAIIAIAVLPPTVATGIVIAAALILGYALDAADGQLARLRGGGSLTGEWLDHMIDSGKITLLHLAVLVAGHRFFATGSIWLLVPIAFTVISVVHFFGMLLTEQLLRNSGAPARPQQGASVLMSAAKLPTDYGILCVVFVLWGWSQVFQVVYSLLALGTIVYTAAVLVVWYRRLNRADASRTEPAATTSES